MVQAACGDALIMKLLWLIPLTVDGAFQFTSKNEMARGLKEQGHQMETVVAYREEKVPLDGFTRVDYVHTPPSSIMSRLRFHWRMFFAALNTDAEAVMFGSQVCHFLPLLRLLALFREQRPVYLLDIRTIPVDLDHGWRSKREVWRYNAAIRLADWFCDGITVITPMLGETVRPHLRRIKGDLGVWTSGVCLEHFEPEGDSMRDQLGLGGKKVLLYHGTLSPNRGLQDAIRALALLSDRYPDLVFLIVGDGKGKQELEALAGETGLVDRILFTGKVPYSDVPRYVRVADISILPFPDIVWWRVSSPIKLMEYLAMGTPIVATDIPAHRWVAEQTGGVELAVDSSPEKLAAAISNVIEKDYTPVPRSMLEDVISWRRQARSLVEFVEQLV